MIKHTPTHPTTRLIWTLLAATLLFGWSGCAAENDEQPDAGDDRDIEYPDVDAGDSDFELDVTQNPSNALSYYVSWETGSEATTRLRVTCNDGWEQVYSTDEMVTEHEVFVMGLWDGAGCQLLARSETGSGEELTGHSTLAAGPLPDFLPTLDVATHQNEQIQEGWTLFNLSNHPDNIPLIIAIVDEQGRFRWYHQRAVSYPGSDNDTRVVPDGVLVGGILRGMPPALFDWEGNKLWEGDFVMHHHLKPVRGGDQYIYIAATRDCPEDINAAVVRWWDPQQDEMADEFDFCNIYQPPDYFPDWAHVNAAEPFPDEDAILISPRTQHSLIKADLTDESIEWVLGLHGEFGLSGDDLFYRQHAPEIQEDGNIVLFDNGKNPERPYSRALEISYDTSDMTAEVVWTYEPDPQIFTPIWGDADRLDNGNTLVTFGHWNPEKKSHIHEVTADKTLVWELKTPDGWGWYRAQRVVDLPVGYVVE